MKNTIPERVSGKVLRAYLESEQRWCIDVRRNDGSRSLQIDPLQGRVLSRVFGDAVEGVVVRERLRYIVASVPRGAMIRVLRMDPPHSGEITPGKSSDMHWAARYDRAKGGYVGGRSSFGGFYHAA